MCIPYSAIPLFPHLDNGPGIEDGNVSVKNMIYIYFKHSSDGKVMVFFRRALICVSSPFPDITIEDALFLYFWFTNYITATVICGMNLQAVTSSCKLENKPMKL